jgi:hypothetical protein
MSRFMGGRSKFGIGPETNVGADDCVGVYSAASDKVVSHHVSRKAGIDISAMASLIRNRIGNEVDGQ